MSNVEVWSHIAPFSFRRDTEPHTGSAPSYSLGPDGTAEGLFDETESDLVDHVARELVIGLEGKIDPFDFGILGGIAQHLADRRPA